LKAILVRIGVDHAYGGWNAPVNRATGEFVYVPIPDGPAKTYRSGSARGFVETDLPLAEFGARNLVPGLRCPDPLRQRHMHLDPDFESLTYGDNATRRGTQIARLVPNDLLAFYAGLRAVDGSNGLVYALVGLFVVDEVLPAVSVLPERRHENAHTRWAEISGNDVVVRGKRGLSGRFDRCIPIGEWRDRAYRVRRDVEGAWGGLSVKDGYIQRSAVPPAFLDAAKFASWFRRQGVSLVERNN
jgi:hypothetical protein